MINFGEWLLPSRYSSIIKEHNTVRNAVGLFDLDHMGQIEIRGSEALGYLQNLMTFDISRILPGQARYSLSCYPDGTIVDDMFIYHLPEHYLIVVNASNIDKDVKWLLYWSRHYRVTIRNLSDSLCMLALQGPNSEKVLQQVVDIDLSEIHYHHCTEVEFAGACALISRTGYTGEDGFELFLPIEIAAMTWDSLLEAGKNYGIAPVGLGARDTLRFEARLPLYGYEIDSNINPYEAGLGWAVSLYKRNFIGKENLLKIRLEGIDRKLIGFEVLGKRIARHGNPLLLGSKSIGYVTSGTYSPTFGKSLGLGYVLRGYATLGRELEVSISGRTVEAIIVKTPFYEPRRKL